MSAVGARWAALAILALVPAGCEDLLQEPESGKLPLSARIVAVSGDGQTGTSGRALDAPLSVRVVDAEGRPLSRIRVEWSPAAAAGRAEPRNSFTDADGAAGTTWVLGPGAGEQRMRAGLGAADAVEFRATGVP